MSERKYFAKKNDIFIAYSAIIIFIFVSVLVSTRDVSVGSDTENYARYFKLVSDGGIHSRFEFAFSKITEIVALLSKNVSVYFAALFLILNFFIYKCSKMSLDGFRNNFDIYYIIGFFLSSSWYQTAALNGIRQGISIPIMYVALIYLAKKKYVRFLLFAIISINFHISSVLVMPFIFLLFINDRFVLLSFFFCGLMYASGLSELLLKSVSDFVGLSFYNNVIEYQSETDRWVGFQLEFFLYTMFWGVTLYFANPIIKQEYIEKFRFTWKMYCMLMMPYFFFAHGAYSNRYAFIGWMFIPILLTSIMVFSKISTRNRMFFSFVVLAFGFFLFLIELRLF